MRVAILNAGFTGGGAERVARELFRDLNARGFDATFFTSRAARGTREAVVPLRFPGERFLKLFEPAAVNWDWRYLGSRARLPRLPNRFDVAHLHNAHGGWVSMTALAQLARRMPVVWTFHDEWAITGGIPYDLARSIPPADVERLFGPGFHANDPAAVRWMRRFDNLMPRPTLILCHSQYILDLVRNAPHWHGTPAHLVRPGISLLQLPDRVPPKAQARARLGLPPDRPVVLLIANLMNATYKGIPLGVEAMRRLPPDRFTLLLVGNGSDEVARRVPQPSVVRGYLPDARSLADAYAAADLTLVPSVAEAFGLVAAESLVCGTPFAGFRVGGLVEIAGDDERGLLAPPVDCDALADRIRRLLDAPELAARMGHAGRQWVAANCAPDDSLRRTVSVYENAIDAFRQLNSPPRPRGATPGTPGPPASARPSAP